MPTPCPAWHIDHCSSPFDGICPALHGPGDGIQRLDDGIAAPGAAINERNSTDCLRRQGERRRLAEAANRQLRNLEASVGRPRSASRLPQPTGSVVRRVTLNDPLQTPPVGQSGQSGRGVGMTSCQTGLARRPVGQRTFRTSSPRRNCDSSSAVAGRTPTHCARSPYSARSSS